MENAIVHGVSKSMQESVILIKSEFLADQLVLSVENNASNFRSLRREKKNGIGLNNVENRIQIYFGEDARLKVSTSKAEVFRCRILIPKKYLSIKPAGSMKGNSGSSKYQSNH